MMKRLLTAFCILLTGVSMLLAGCTKKEDVEKGEPVDFTVVSREEVPEELAEILTMNKEKEIMLSYKLEDHYYLIRGYGRQESGGYSITVNGLWLKEDGIHMETVLVGPSSGEEIPKEPSYPYVESGYF